MRDGRAALGLTVWSGLAAHKASGSAAPFAATERDILLAVDVIVPRSRPWQWQKLAIERLQRQGHDVAVVVAPGASGPPAVLAAMLALERTLLRRRHGALAAIAEELPGDERARPADLRLDLTGVAASSEVPTVALTFDGSVSPIAIVESLAAGRLPAIEAVLDGRQVLARAMPMVDRRESIALGLEDVLARAVTLVGSVAKTWSRGPHAGGGEPPSPAKTGGLPPVLAYAASAPLKIGREALRRARFHHAHWRVGYRFVDGPGVAETGMLGHGWSVLPDRGDRFYADPFPFEWQGRSFVFVEDYPHATRKGVISVVAFDAGGRPEAPVQVLEEPWHLSYPQLFARDGAIWMLPEASAGRRLVLYRATRFPDRWQAEATLLDGVEISDATLLDHAGRLWLFATERDGFGSTSDTLVVFSAPDLAGPWTPHPLNPVLIDRRRARPGGAFVRRGGRLFLPVQDGTPGYGGGLGIAELTALDERTVAMSDPVPVSPAGDWPYPMVHSLNRCGRLEVIDGIVAMRKR